jgi:hypothetical protein
MVKIITLLSWTCALHMGEKRPRVRNHISPYSAISLKFAPVGSVRQSNLIAALACKTSLHAPLLLRLSGRGPILELLPLLRRLVILPVDHMRVDFLGRAYRRVPQPRRHGGKRYAAGQQVRAVRMPQGVEARALRQLQPAKQ